MLRPFFLHGSFRANDKTRSDLFSETPTDQCLKSLFFLDELRFRRQFPKTATRAPDANGVDPDGGDSGCVDLKSRFLSLSQFDEETIDSCVSEIVSELKERYGGMSPLGKCAIDDALAFLPIPLTKSLAERPFLQGVPTPLPAASDGFARFYVGWFNEHGNDDVDLIARFIGPKRTGLLNWEPRRQSYAYACFSGEVRGRRGSCAEFVDVDLARARHEFRYLVVYVSRLTKTSFSAMKTTFGFEKRDGLEPDASWTPESAADQTRVVSKRSDAIVAIVDLKKRQCFSCDASRNAIPFYSRNYEEIKASIERLTQPPKFSMRDLLTWHVASRGELVPWNEFYKADRFFSLEEFYKTDKAAQWLLDDE